MKKKLSIKKYVEYYFSKYKELSSFDVEVLVNSILNSELSDKKRIKDIRSYVTILLKRLKDDNKIIKNSDKKWIWIE